MNGLRMGVISWLHQQHQDVKLTMGMLKLLATLLSLIAYSNRSSGDMNTVHQLFGYISPYPWLLTYEPATVIVKIVRDGFFFPFPFSFCLLSLKLCSISSLFSVKDENLQLRWKALFQEDVWEAVPGMSLKKLGKAYINFKSSYLSAMVIFTYRLNGNQSPRTGSVRSVNLSSQLNHWNLKRANRKVWVSWFLTLNNCLWLWEGFV